MPGQKTILLGKSPEHSLSPGLRLLLSTSNMLDIGDPLKCLPTLRVGVCLQLQNPWMLTVIMAHSFQ